MTIALHKLDQANLIRCVFLRVEDRAEIEVPVFLKAKHRHIFVTRLCGSRRVLAGPNS